MRRRTITIIGYAVPAAAAAVLVLLVFLSKDHLAPPRLGSGLLGRQGEWVTRPDGRRVCRLSADLRIVDPVGPAFCTEWQEPTPAVGQWVDGWVRPKDGGGYQIMIEGKWRP